MSSAWCKAQVWAKDFAIKNIQSLEDCLALTIRQLRAVASKLAKKEPYIFTKHRFGKAVSRMSKFELAQAIWEVRKIALSCPKSRNWQEEIISGRISYAACDGERWVSCFGFDVEQEAYKFFQWLHEKKACIQASLRLGKRTDSAFEVKVWGMPDKVFDAICQRDVRRMTEGALANVCKEYGIVFEKAIGQLTYKLTRTNLQPLGHVRYVPESHSWEWCLSYFKGDEEQGSLRWAVEKVLAYYQPALVSV